MAFFMIELKYYFLIDKAKVVIFFGLTYPFRGIIRATVKTASFFIKQAFLLSKTAFKAA